MRPFTAGRYKSTLNLPLTARVMLGGDTAEGLACPMPTSAGDSPCPYSRTSSFWMFSWLSGAAHVHLGQEKQMGCSGCSTEEGWALPSSLSSFHTIGFIFFPSLSRFTEGYDITSGDLDLPSAHQADKSVCLLSVKGQE